MADHGSRRRAGDASRRSLTFGLGAIGFAGAITASKVASARVTQFVSVALIVMALSRIVPLSVAQFYIHGLAAVAVMWPLAYVMRTNPVPSSRLSA